MNNKTLLTVAIVAGVAIAGYYLYHKSKTPQTGAITPAPQNGNENVRNDGLLAKAGSVLEAGKSALDEIEGAFGGF